MRPFIRDLADVQSKPEERRDRRGRGQHPGMLLQRYLCEIAAGDKGNPEEKRAILKAAINAARDPGLREFYKAAFERRQGSYPKVTESVDLVTPGRLIIGLGSENVLETGLRLDHTYGMPMLPGSALKGLASHYCHQAWGGTGPAFRKPSASESEAYARFLAGREPAPTSNFHRLLFGDTDDSGCVIFHDAWLTPDSPNPLRLDVMTPHHPRWLDGSVPPTDFDSPIPVPFLSVAGTFRVAVSWRGPSSDAGQHEKWTKLALELLREALERWGVGGKTSSGYGRLSAQSPPS